WHDYDSPILPPIISPVPSVNTLEQKILVYLPWESSHTISQALLSFTDYEFFIYHDIPRKKREKNLFWHPYAPTFLDDLASSSGVISNAGFELPSEALSAGKKLLVKPLKGQAEQEANALALKQLGLGMVSTDLSSQDISFWLDRSTSSKIPVMHDVQPLLEWIEKGNWSSIDSLKKQYWS
ncbi:MAG: glycosyltransferase, partial [Nanoarchaeota archaeon]|nr:glycosyltransferase [Nanoarchaeota archaeon]